MKKVWKVLRRLFRQLVKDKWNIAIAILVLLVFILGIMVVGIIKTIMVLFIVILLVLAIKYGGMVFMGRKGKDTHKERGPKKKWKKNLNLAIIICLWAGIAMVVGGIAFMGYVVLSAPKFDSSKLLYKEASVFYDKDGKEIMRMGKEMRDKVTYDELPQVFVDAIVATEDSRFFEHNGFDLPRFLKASAGQLMGNSGAGGASTISMQVVKNNFTSTKQTIVRKFSDIYLAVFKLEKAYTKEQILEFYVNQLHFSVNNSYGIAEASRNIFGKEISDINLSEAALLAGMFQAPSSYNPYRFPERAAARRSTVLYLMERHGYITNEERKIADAIPIESLLTDQQQSSHPYQSYIDYASEEVFDKTGNDPMIVPMKVYTNLDTKKQDFVNDVLKGNSSFKWENDTVQAGIAVTDPNTGAVLALGDGRNRTGAKLYSLAADSKLQVGSTAKPLFDYGPGMEFNNWSTYTPFVDDVYSYSDGKEINNWNNTYLGMLTLKYALGQSRNIPALKAFQQVDNKKIIEFVESLGITPEVEDGRIHEAHAIGGFNGASPLQLAIAYAAFDNGGYYIAPSAVNKIELMDSNEVQTFTPEKVKVMSDSTAYMITNVLKYAVDNSLVGGGKTSGVEVAAKSGTTNFDQVTKDRNHLPDNAIRDLWYAGYSPDTVIAMWMGYEKISDGHSTSPRSSGFRDRLFTTLANGIFEKTGNTFTVPSSVVSVPVEMDSIPAMLPSQYTPSSLITTEVFKRGTEPTEVSPRFNTLPNVTSLDVTQEGSNVKLTWSEVTLPDLITQEYLDTIFAQKDKYINIRRQKDAAYLGTLGYNVYVKNANGTLSFLGWTASPSYTHKPTSSGTLSYVVKTCYSIFKASESSGATAVLSDNPYVSPALINLKGKGSTPSDPYTVVQNGAYNDPGISVLVDGNDVTNNATIDSITVVNKTGTYNRNYTRLQDIVLVTTTVGEEYTITYKISYGETDQTLTRTVRIISG